MSSPDRVRALLAPVVDGAGLVLEDVTITPAGRRRVVRVVVDLPDDAEGSVDLDAVADVSRAVSDALDAGDVLGGSPYVLEVTSPGVDRPLTERRHWSRARGRLVVADLHTEGGPVTGRVLATGDDGVTLDTGSGRTTLPWDAVRRGRVQVEFNRPGATTDEEG
ncbi:MAG: ribosome maturation factor RimP [Actinomycetota bacterium]